MAIICAIHEPGRGTWIAGDDRHEFRRVQPRGSGFFPGTTSVWVVGELAAIGAAGNMSHVREFWERAKEIRPTQPHFDYACCYRDAVDRFKSKEIDFILSTPYGSWHGQNFEHGYISCGEKSICANAAARVLRNKGCSYEVIARESVSEAMETIDKDRGELFVHLLSMHRFSVPPDPIALQP